MHHNSLFLFCCLCCASVGIRVDTLRVFHCVVDKSSETHVINPFQILGFHPFLTARLAAIAALWRIQ